jgi:exonuclease III
VIFLQEHWLREDELNKLKAVNSDFSGFGVSAIDTTSGILSGRPYGGVCILWRKSLSKYIIVVQYDDKRMIGCKLCINNNVYLFVNVYLPYQCYENFDDYVHYLGKLISVVEESDSSSIVLVGDFNAKVGSIFENELLNFVKTCNMYISDYEWFGSTSDTFTYVSDAHFTTSWLDHYICSFSMHNNISEIKITDKLPCSDHLPLSVVFSHDGDIDNDIANRDNDNIHHSHNQTCNWHKATPEDIIRYEHTTKTFLCNIRIPLEALSCTDSRCDSIKHRNGIDHMYTEVCDALHRASALTIPTNRCNTASQYIIPGWNEYVREAHIEARHAYVTWRDFGKPRHGSVCDLMKVTRLRFKYALRQCQAMEETARADALATSLSHKDMTAFWKSIKTLNNKNLPLATSINGITGEENISEMWSQHYSGILNCVNNISRKGHVQSVLHSIDSTDRFIITPNDIAMAIRNLKRGKSVGFDLLASEHYIHSDHMLKVFLALLYTVYTRLLDADLIQNITVIFVLRLILAISPEGRCKTQPQPCDGRPMSDNTG